MIVDCNKIWQYLEDDTQLILPWYTLHCLHWLKKQHVYDWNVFEFGVGYSTIWWRSNAHGLTSIETNERWARAMGAIWIAEEEIHLNFIEKVNRKYDCIIVDGMWREKCVEAAVPFLKKGGYLIIDNWESEDYDPKVNEELLKDWEITLFKQPNHSSWTTAVLQKP